MRKGGVTAENEVAGAMPKALEREEGAGLPGRRHLSELEETERSSLPQNLPKHAALQTAAPRPGRGKICVVWSL